MMDVGVEPVYFDDDDEVYPGMLDNLEWPLAHKHRRVTMIKRMGRR